MPASRIASCILCIFPFASSSFADTLPLATYTLTFQVGRNAPPEVISNTVVPNTVAQLTKTGRQNGQAYVGQVNASSFPPAFVSAGGEVNQLGKTTSEMYLAGSSTLTYNLEVVQEAPAPVDTVPLLGISRGEVSAAGPAKDAGASATATLDIPALDIFDSVSAQPTQMVPVTFNNCASAPVGQDIQAQLQARGFAFLGVPGGAGFQAGLDPTIQIDPSFAYARDFTLVFSPNLTSSSGVPEPSPIALFAAGLLGLMAAGRPKPRGISKNPC